ncbi:hypothetical protein [Saccharicrinis aurantiacus]|uniref:hypothetical protein n=1 Tax=Saccharicrinis aurantiacus TaxID=1849719 RepID=UPI000950204C|nr:hypothetical protein [Saccharicrinis aurantiacus]
MANENIEIVDSLQQKIGLLVSRYNDLKTENGNLLAENDKLTTKLEEGARETAALREKYNTLKFSKAIEVTSGDVHGAKIRINQIVREIDKCIALLNR